MSDETKPILVNASPVNDQVAAAIRTLVLCLGVVSALAGFVEKRDLAGFIAYMQSSEFLAAAALLIAGGMFLWGQWKTRHRAKQLATVGANPEVPSEIISLK